MIEKLTTVPRSMVGFRASGEVTKADFDEVVIPAVRDFVHKNNELNYMLILDTPVKNFTLAAWWKDAILGLANLTKWNRAAIVTDSKAISLFTDIFSKVMPGEFKGFDQRDLEKAIDWTAGTTL